jgi:hypothetical protein
VASVGRLSAGPATQSAVPANARARWRSRRRSVGSKRSRGFGPPAATRRTGVAPAGSGARPQVRGMPRRSPRQDVSGSPQRSVRDSTEKFCRGWPASRSPRCQPRPRCRRPTAHSSSGGSACRTRAIGRRCCWRPVSDDRRGDGWRARGTGEVPGTASAQDGSPGGSGCRQALRTPQQPPRIGERLGGISENLREVSGAPGRMQCDRIYDRDGFVIGRG